MMRGLSVAALLVVLLAGCTSSKLSGQASGFGKLTLDAVAAQKLQLSAYAEEEAKDIAAELAEKRVELTYSSACLGLANHTDEPAACVVLTASGDKVPTPFAATNTVELAASLGAYADGLVQLSGDFSKDSTAFSASLALLATRVGGLSGAISSVAQQKLPFSTAQLSAVANIAATVGNLYLESERANALRRIIVAADPFVREATLQLARSDEQLRGIGLARAFEKMRLARVALSKAVASEAASTAVGVKQKEFLKAFDDYKRQAAMKSGFLALGEAHGQLAAIAKSGGSAADMAAYFLKLTTAAKSIAQSVQTLKVADGKAK
jgi:hypothetical protein